MVGAELLGVLLRRLLSPSASGVAQPGLQRGRNLRRGGLGKTEIAGPAARIERAVEVRVVGQLAATL